MILTKNGVPFQFFREVSVNPSRQSVFVGRFHEWGSEICDDSAYTIGIVEHADGQISTHYPSEITFTGATETVSI